MIRQISSGTFVPIYIAKIAPGILFIFIFDYIKYLTIILFPELHLLIRPIPRTGYFTFLFLAIVSGSVTSTIAEPPKSAIHKAVLAESPVFGDLAAVCTCFESDTGVTVTC